jgi:hypothetical protein
MLGVLLHAPRGPFYSPKAARSRWRAIQEGNSCLLSGGAPDSPVHHRTLPGADCFPILAQSIVEDLEPLAHRTLSGAHRIVRCPLLTVGSATRHARIARPTVGSADRWLTGQSGAPPYSPVNYSRTPLIASRERRLRRGWLTGQSGVPPDSPVIISRTPSSSLESGLFFETGPGAPDTVRCTTGQSGAPRPKLSLDAHCQLFSKLFSPISST